MCSHNELFAHSLECYFVVYFCSCEATPVFTKSSDTSDISDGYAQMSDEISQIWIGYTKPIGQISDEPWKFFGYTATPETNTKIAHLLST